MMDVWPGVSRKAPSWIDRLDGGRRADASRVEELIAFQRAALVAGHGAPCQTKREDSLAFQEERALLLVERLVRRQVDDRRVRLDLAEVWIDRRVHREVRREADLRVEPDRAGAVRCRRMDSRPARAATRPVPGVRQQLDAPSRLQSRESRAAHRSCRGVRCPAAG